LLAATRGLGHDFLTPPPVAMEAAAKDRADGQFVSIGNASLHIYALPLHGQQSVAATLVLYHDAAFIESQIARMWRDSLVNAAIQTILISTLALLLVRWTFIGPLVKTARWMRSLRTGSS